MAPPRSSPTNSNSHVNYPPPTTSSNTPFTPRSTSVADESDTEFDPTPLQSPGGPAYDDLPPSYDEAQHQAISDARNGVVPLDPNQIEAHRLTLNEGPNEPEIWEYRIRGEELDAENERAPEYSNVTDNSGNTAVPVQHVESSTNIPVGQNGARGAAATTTVDPSAELLSRALNFTRHEPDADAQYAPRLARRVAIPQENIINDPLEPIQFSRAYAKALHAHSIRPAEFAEFLDGLNAACIASNATLHDLLHASSTVPTPSIVQEYIRGANEAFFAPRGLRVSLQSLSGLIEALDIPAERGVRAGAIASALDPSITTELRAQALHPWIEAIDTNVPAQSAQSSVLREMAERIRRRGEEDEVPIDTHTSGSGNGKEHEDPPHSILEDPNIDAHRSGNKRRGRLGRGRGRGNHRGEPWTPFGPPGHGPFGAPGHGPFGPVSTGPFGPPGYGPRGPPGCNPHGSPGYSHDRSGPSQPHNEWAALGQNIGKWGEEFGRRMGDWGQQFGKQAGDWGQDFGQRANTWGQNVGQYASGQRGGSFAQASSSGSRHGHGAPSAPTDDALPPAYQAPVGQESGVFRRDEKTSHEPPKYEESNASKANVKNSKDEPYDDNDDDSSISSSSSDSSSDTSSDSDSDDDLDEISDAQDTFLKRVQSINKQAEAAAQKGKKTPEEISSERAVAIEKAQQKKLDVEEKAAERKATRDMQRSWQQKRKDHMREYREKKKEMRVAHTNAHATGGKGKGKGKGKAKVTKTPGWKQAKKEYRAKRKEMKKERLQAKKEWRERKPERMRARREARTEGLMEGGLDQDMVWVVIENLDS